MVFVCECGRVTYGSTHGLDDGRIVCRHCYFEARGQEAPNYTDSFIFESTSENQEQAMQVLEVLERMGLISNLREFDGEEYGT